MSVFTRGDPALVAQTQFLLDGVSERLMPVWSTWESVIGGYSVELRTVSRLHSNADEKGDKRGE